LQSGISDDWHLNLSVGKMRYKTEAIITTRNTTIKWDSAVLDDYGPGVAATVRGLNTERNFNLLMCRVANVKNGTSNTCDGTSSGNQGTYVRKASNVLDSTLFVLSVGRSF
jgi:hypothetical protein